jgi:N-acetylglucosaminyldiphosphoundecaprenol N-acetyl-beta-D-mannosaminyltransferase
MKNSYDTINFLGYKFASSQIDDLLINLFSQVESGTKLKIVFTPNPEQLVFAKSYSWFDKTLGKSDTLLPDGMGIIVGSQILSAFGKGKPILYRIAGVDVVSGLLDHFADQKILIIGGRGYAGLAYQDWKVVDITEKNDRNKAEKIDLNITTGKHQDSKLRVGQQRDKLLYWHEGFLNVSQPTEAEEEGLLKLIKRLKPQIVFVAFGAPHQEKWVIEHKRFFEESGVRLAMVVGGAFDMLLGKVQRAPKWMRLVGLEWLFRLSQEPWRWRRQLNLFVFIKMVFQEALS